MEWGRDKNEMNIFRPFFLLSLLLFWGHKQITNKSINFLLTVDWSELTKDIIFASGIIKDIKFTPGIRLLDIKSSEW